MRFAIVLSVLVSIGAVNPVLAEEFPTEATKPRVPIESWLVAGPQDVPLPAFATETDALEAAHLLDVGLADLRELAPREGDDLRAAGKAPLAWRALKAPDAVLTFDRGTSNAPRAAWAASYLSVDRFVAGALSVKSEHPVRVRLGESVLGKAGSHDIGMPRGVHRLLVESVLDPAKSEAWSVTIAFEPKEGGAPITVTLSPARSVLIDDVLDATATTDVALSFDGALLALRRQKPAAPTDNREEWIEIRDVATGALVFRSTSTLESFVWSPVARAYAYITRKGDRATLWTASVDGPAAAVIDNVEQLSSPFWAPDGLSLFYVISEKDPENEATKKTGLVRVPSLPWRRADYRERGHLYEVRLADRARRRLTAGPFTTALADVSPDGTRLLVTRTREDKMEEPFASTEIYEIDRATLAARLVTTARWNATPLYAPDGARLAVVASPLAFGDAGIEAGVTRPNEYDNELYELDLATGGVTSLTRAFAPNVLDAQWSRADGALYLRAESGEYERIYRVEPRTLAILPIAAEVDSVAVFALARSSGVLAYRGTSANDPGGVFVLDGFDASPARLVVDGASESFRRDVTLGDVRDFDFTTDDGTVIRGRVHLPPGFDATRRHPAIVYYYGGTSPVGRTFGGRYPFALWTAHGYVVYVLQPSGATGFGQTFSAQHVNDWGQRTVGEIIRGTERFLEAHPFVDPQRVGCIGASYGGFMTQLLITHTTMFRAAVSHAGISAIPSYWGEGHWGYLYNAQSAAGSYPWNARELYVDQSPLFRADRIETPLLLLHGASDTNVPVGESEQMYTALKVLGREVEYVRVEGEDHWIIAHAKRRAWSQTILAWFDKQLKAEPQWWNYIFDVGKRPPA